MAKNTRPHSSTTKRSFGRAQRKRPVRQGSKEEFVKFYGIQACLALFERRRADIRRLFVHPDIAERFALVARWCARHQISVKTVESEELSRVTGTEHHEGVCIEARALPTRPLHELSQMLRNLERACVLILEGVENPHNVGAILRTSCFFGVSAVVLLSRSVKSLSGAACRVAEGAAEIVPITIVSEYGALFTNLRKSGFCLVATTPHEAQSLYTMCWAPKVAVLFGAEGTGLSGEALKVADKRVAIPRLGPLESLNVGAAVASVLTEARREVVTSGVIHPLKM